MSNTQTLFMYRNCGYNKGYESPMKERNPAKKIKTMTKNIDINLNMFNKKSHNNDDYKIKNYDDENIFDKPHNHPHADRNNIFKSNLIKRVIDPGITVHRNHDARAAERIVESKFQNNQYNGYDFFKRSKVSDSIRDKITLMSTEFTSTLNSSKRDMSSRTNSHLRVMSDYGSPLFKKDDFNKIFVSSPTNNNNSLRRSEKTLLNFKDRVASVSNSLKSPIKSPRKANMRSVDFSNTKSSFNNMRFDNSNVFQSLNMQKNLQNNLSVANLKNSMKENSFKDRLDFVVNSTRTKDFKVSDNDNLYSTNFSHNFKKLSSRNVSSSTNFRKSNAFTNFDF